VLPPRPPNGYGNHSCEPNLWREGPYELVARQDLQPGEELTSDYATSTVDPSWSMACTCGSASCRGIIRGDDWERMDLDAQYDGHIVPGHTRGDECPRVAGARANREGASFRRHSRHEDAGLGFYPEKMLDLGEIDVEEIATALADQTDYEHRWLIDPRTGQVAFWTSDTGIDGENPVEIDELDLILIEPVPSYVWFQDMADFADGISDSAAGRRLTRSLQGRGAFRRFKKQVYEHHPELISAWHALRDVRAQRRAVEWLLDQGLIDDSAAQQFATDHPDPVLL